MPQAGTTIFPRSLCGVGTELVGSVLPIFANKRCSNPLNQKYAKHKVKLILPIWIAVAAMDLWFPCYWACCVKAAWEVLFPIFFLFEKHIPFFCEAHEGQKYCLLPCPDLFFFSCTFQCVFSMHWSYEHKILLRHTKEENWMWCHLRK